jgi:hypothetical protein
MKRISVFFVLCLICINAPAQTVITLRAPGKQHLASFTLHVPLGNFGTSHIAGAGLSYSWSHHRYGRMYVRRSGIGLTANGGVDYYLGKKIEEARQDFRYGGYIYLNAQAGIIVNPVKKGNISLTAGPTMGIYKGNADFGWGVNLFGAYLLPGILENNIMIGPGVTYKKHARADALWTAAVRISYCF